MNLAGKFLGIPDLGDKVALCSQVGGDFWFPEMNTDGLMSTIKNAKAICNSCEAQSQCLQWALDTNEFHGIWGGLTGYERRRILRSRDRDIA